MNKLISTKLAGNLLLGSLGLLAAFHILVLLRVLPADIVWGGAIQNSTTSLFPLEIISLLVTLLFAVIISAKAGYIKAFRFQTAVNIGVWVVFAILLLSMIANFASGVAFENLIFAPIAVVLAFCAYRLAIEKELKNWIYNKFCQSAVLAPQTDQHSPAQELRHPVRVLPDIPARGLRYCESRSWKLIVPALGQAGACCVGSFMG